MDGYKDECPVCKSKDYDTDSVDVIQDIKYIKCYCDDCDSTWEQVWAFVKNQNIVDMRN